MNEKWKARLALVLFGLGVLLALFCGGIAGWGDMEATLFDASISPDELLSTVRCPVMITAVETATVRAAFDNPTARPVQVAIRAHFSQGYVTQMREHQESFVLAAGERQWWAWTVGPEDAAFGRRIILVRIHVRSAGPLPYRSGACGIVVAPVSFLTGDLLFGLLAAGSLLGMGGGIALWTLGRPRPLGRGAWAAVRMMGTLAGVVIAAAVVGLLGMWLLDLILLLATVLLSGVMIGFVLTSG
jgi:hypothetical protein